MSNALFCRVFVVVVVFTFSLILTTPIPVSTASVDVPIAIVVYDPTYPVVATPFNGSFSYRPPEPWDRAYFLGTLLAIREAEALGGIPIGPNVYHLKPVMYNFAVYSGPIVQFAMTMITGPQAPIFIQAPLAVAPALDDLSVLIATICESTKSCVLVPGSSTKRLFVCGAVEVATSPECANRLGKRRFTSMLSVLPDSDYISESFIGHMVYKQQRTMALLAFDENFAPDAYAFTPEIASRYGVTIVYQNIIFSSLTSPCNASVAAKLVDEFTPPRPDFLSIMVPESAACVARIVQAMKAVDYFPHAVCIMGGTIVDVAIVLQTTPDMLEYFYGTTPFDETTTGFYWTAVSTESHTELFPATATQSSTGVFWGAFAGAFGQADAASTFNGYTNIGGGAIVFALLLLEAAEGSLNGGVWQSVASQVNSPTFMGFLQMDATGQNLGARDQLLVQVYRNPQLVNSSLPPYPSAIVSPTSSFQDTVPAPTWSVRRYRTYAEEGDQLYPQWSPLYVLIGVALLLLGSWSGFFRMKAALREFNSVVTRRFPIMQVLYMTVSFGVAGSWAFLLIAMQGITFIPASSDVHTTVDIQISLVWCLTTPILALTMILPLTLYMYLNRMARRMAQVNRAHHRYAESSTSLASEITLIDDDEDAALVNFASAAAAGSAEVAPEPREEEEKEKEKEKETEKDRDNNADESFFKDVLIRIRNLPLVVVLGLLLTACLWSLCGLLQQYFLLSALSSTHTRPDALVTGSRAVWVGYFLLISFPTFVAITISGYIYDSDVACTSIQIASLIIIHFLSLVNTTFHYSVAVDVTVIDSSTLVLAVGFVSLGTIVVSVSTMLRKFGANLADYIRALKMAVKERKRALVALGFCMKKLQTAERTLAVHKVQDQFVASQQLFFDQNHRLTSSKQDESFKQILLEWHRVRFGLMVQDIQCLPQPLVTDYHVGAFIDGTFDRKHKQRRKKTGREENQLIRVGVDTNNTKHPAQASQEVALDVEHILTHRVLTYWLSYATDVGLSPENRYFMQCVQDYATMTQHEYRYNAAVFIHAIFIQKGCPFPINIQSNDSNDIAISLLAGPSASSPSSLANLFARVTREVLTLIRTNNMIFLKQHPAFMETVDQLNSLHLLETK